MCGELLRQPRVQFRVIFLTLHMKGERPTSSRSAAALSIPAIDDACGSSRRRRRDRSRQHVVVAVAMIESWFPLGCAALFGLVGGFVGYGQARIVGMLVGVLVAGLLGLIVGGFVSVIVVGALNLKPTQVTRMLAVSGVVVVASAVYAAWGLRR